jgi:hypothetical protein
MEKLIIETDIPLTNRELITVQQIIHDLEWKAYRPLKHITGAYAEAELVRYDDTHLTIKVTSGIEGDYQYTDTILMLREEL